MILVYKYYDRPHLTVTLSARTFAHINSAGFEVELRRHFSMTTGKQRTLDGGAVFIRPDAALPVILTRGRMERHVTWQHRTRLLATDPPRVAKLLT